jgi:hypothetical protein
MRCERTSTEVHSDVGHDDAGCASTVAHAVFAPEYDRGD